MKTLLAIAFFIAAYAFAGTMDYQHEKEQAEHYAEMVCADHWPDYENRNPDCSRFN